jgi:hypothetical protein
MNYQPYVSESTPENHSNGYALVVFIYQKVHISARFGWICVIKVYI